jgi:acyl carrier protein
MIPSDFYLLLDDMLELDPGTITGTERLEDLEGWDSLAVISFIALVDEKFDTLVETDKLAAAESVGDLYALATRQKAA